MENLTILLIPLLLSLVTVRLFFYPIRQLIRLGLHSAWGLLCLWLLNSASLFTGILFPINAVSVWVAGVGGLPGIGMLALLTVIRP